MSIFERAMVSAQLIALDTLSKLMQGIAARAGITVITCITSIQFTKLCHADFVKKSKP